MAELERPDGTRIRYEVSGEGPVVFAIAPGLVNSEVEAWAKSAMDLPAALDGCTVATMDQRYAGLSTGPNIPFTYEAMTADQVAVLDAVGADRAIVAGAGMGANYALRLACLHPERVVAAVLIEPMGRAPGVLKHHAYALFEETCRVARAAGVQGVVDAARANPRFDENPAAGPFGQRLHDDEAFADETVRKGRERYIVRVVRFRDGMFPAGTPFYSVEEGEVASCRVPVLVVPGHDALRPPEMGAMLDSQLAHAQVLGEGGDLAAAVRAFIADHAAHA